jgi:uncharacterized membrane protein YphA (DoxX/SURF4 family)
MAGVYKVFQMGAMTHAEVLFIEQYKDTFLPLWSLWLTGTTIPFIELIAGALLLLGFWSRPALIALGTVLLLVTFGHLLKEPFYGTNVHVIPRLILVLFILMLPKTDDRFSLRGVVGMLRSRSRRT